MNLAFAVSRSALALVAALLFAGCAPSVAPTTKPTTTQNTTTVTKPPVSQPDLEALESAMFRKGEVWSITALSADGKIKRVHNVEITGVAVYDAEATEVYISAKSGALGALTYYDPDTKQQAVEVYLDNSKDPKITFCDFDDARRGLTQQSGVSYFGLRSKLRATLQSNVKLGSCELQKVK